MGALNMKKSAKISKVNRNLGSKAVLALLLVALWGCDGTRAEWGERTGRMVSILNDSLALIQDWRPKSVCKGMVTNVSCVHSSHNAGLHLVNYQQQQPVLLSDTLSYYLNVMRGYVRDSVAFVVHENTSKFAFWKVGQKPSPWKDWYWPSSCARHISVEDLIRPWKNNQFIIRERTASCPNVLLDTTTGQVSIFEFSGENAWLSECTDFSYVDGKIYCLRVSSPQTLDLLVDNELMDVLHSEACEFVKEKQLRVSKESVELFNEYVSIQTKCSYGYNHHKLDADKMSFDTTFSEVTLKGKRFIHQDGRVVDYYE